MDKQPKEGIMGERENIRNCDGNLEALRRYENRLASGEEQLEKIQALLDDELEGLMEEFRENIKTISKNFYDYDLIDYAEEYVKDNL